jgi:hypothetical protein
MLMAFGEDVEISQERATVNSRDKSDETGI